MGLKAEFNCLCQTGFKDSKFNLCIPWQPCPLRDLATIISTDSFISMSYLKEIVGKRKDVTIELSEDKKIATITCLKPAEQAIAESGVTGLDPATVRPGELLVSEKNKKEN